MAPRPRVCESQRDERRRFRTSPAISSHRRTTSTELIFRSASPAETPEWRKLATLASSTLQPDAQPVRWFDEETDLAARLGDHDPFDRSSEVQVVQAAHPLPPNGPASSSGTDTSSRTGPPTRPGPTLRVVETPGTGTQPRTGTTPTLTNTPTDSGTLLQQGWLFVRSLGGPAIALGTAFMNWLLGEHPGLDPAQGHVTLDEHNGLHVVWLPPAWPRPAELQLTTLAEGHPDRVLAEVHEERGRLVARTTDGVVVATKAEDHEHWTVDVDELPGNLGDQIRAIEPMSAPELEQHGLPTIPLHRHIKIGKGIYVFDPETGELRLVAVEDATPIDPNTAVMSAGGQGEGSSRGSMGNGNERNGDDVNDDGAHERYAAGSDPEYVLSLDGSLEREGTLVRLDEDETRVVQALLEASAGGNPWHDVDELLAEPHLKEALLRLREEKAPGLVVRDTDYTFSEVDGAPQLDHEYVRLNGLRPYSPPEQERPADSPAPSSADLLAKEGETVDLPVEPTAVESDDADTGDSYTVVASNESGEAETRAGSTPVLLSAGLYDDYIVSNDGSVERKDGSPIELNEHERQIFQALFDAFVQGEPYLFEDELITNQELSDALFWLVGRKTQNLITQDTRSDATLEEVLYPRASGELFAWLIRARSSRRAVAPRLTDRTSPPHKAKAIPSTSKASSRSESRPWSQASQRRRNLISGPPFSSTSKMCRPPDSQN